MSGIIVPFVGETHRDAVLAECTDFFYQAIVKLAVPFALQEGLDVGATL